MRQDWCDQCATSGAITFDLYILTEHGPRSVATVWHCTVCHPMTARQVRDEIARKLGDPS